MFRGSQVATFGAGYDEPSGVAENRKEAYFAWSPTMNLMGRTGNKLESDYFWKDKACNLTSRIISVAATALVFWQLASRRVIKPTSSHNAGD